VIGLDDNELLLRCSCGSKEHIAWLTYEPADQRDHNMKEMGDDWYLSIGLDRFRFWKRLRTAVRYVFGSYERYGAYVEIVLKNEDMDKISTFIGTRLAETHLAELRAEEAKES